MSEEKQEKRLMPSEITSEDIPIIKTNLPIPALKTFPNKKQTDIRYSLIEPYVSVHIYWNDSLGEVVYEIEEPILTKQEKKVLERLEEGITELLNVNLILEKTEGAILSYLHKTAKLLIAELGIRISRESYNRVFYYLWRDFIGLNEIESLTKDFFIEDIECNGINSPVYIVHRIYRNLRTNIIYQEVDGLASFVEKLAQRAGRYISYANPILDGSLPDGSRVNATYTTDITSKGPTFTIRKFTKVPWTPPQLIALNTVSPEMLAYFWILLQYKMNLLIIGGTGSGKTTMLNALAFFIPPEARIVSIEDSITGDSRIIIKQAENVKDITIKEFVDNKIDAEIMTLDKKGKIMFAKPSNYIKHVVKKDIYEVLTSTGRKIKVTQDHSLFTLGNGIEGIKPTDLIEGKSFIAVPRVLPINPPEKKEINLIKYLEIFKDDFLVGDPLKRFFEKYKLEDFNIKKERYKWWKKHNLIKISNFLKRDYNFSYDELRKLKIKSKNKACLPVIFEITNAFLTFCGLWVGDGSYDRYNKNSVIVSNSDEECRELIKKIANYLGSNYSIMNDKGVSLRIHSTVFYKFMKNALGFTGHSATKKIPEFIFNLSNEQIKHFIKGYFSADGTVKKCEVSCASQSYTLLEDLQTMFLRLGIISRINDFNRKDKCINMSISSSENIEAFKEIGFLQERKNKKLLLLNKRAHHTHSDVIPLSVTKVGELNNILNINLQHGYLVGRQNIGRNYMQKIAPADSRFNDLSHNDILWDKVKKVRKTNSKEVEVFDLSILKYEKFLCNNIFVHNTRELNLPRENWLPSVARTGVGIKGEGNIDLFALLKASFRQNPDYVIVGEVRGKEAFVLFQGMASGHPSISTLHADSVNAVVRRLETPPINLSPTLINSLDTIAIMAHSIVQNKETRRMREVNEIQNVTPSGQVTINTPFKWNPQNDVFYYNLNSRVFQKIMQRYGISQQQLIQEFKNRTRLLYELYRRKIFEFTTVQKIINSYYKSPGEVLKQFGILG